jgi:hypothetical protein
MKDLEDGRENNLKQNPPPTKGRETIQIPKN